MNPSLSDQRLFELQLRSLPEEAGEMAWLEDYIAWKKAGGVKGYEYKRQAERNRQLLAHHKVDVEKAKRK